MVDEILVVDDHPLIVRALEESLPHVDSRFEVIAAANREQTLTALAPRNVRLFVEPV